MHTADARPLTAAAHLDAGHGLTAGLWMMVVTGAAAANAGP